MYGRILVPTDGSDAAKKAADGAVELAKQFSSEIHAVHFVEPGKVPSDVESEVSAELGEYGEQIVNSIADSATDKGVQATTRVIETTSPVHEEIVEYVTEHDIDLIVMGTHGRSGLDRLIVGSVAERTLRVAPIPVLTVHSETTIDAEFETILIPTDGSETADIAADRAIQIGAATGAAVHIVHVVDLTVVPDEPDGVILDAMEAEGQQAVNRIIGRAEAAGIHAVEASVLSGTPAKAIVDYTTARDVDLVVMGTHGRSGLQRYLLGSVTEKVVRLADMPVLSVSPTESD